MTPGEAIAFVETQGIVLESGKGSIPNLADTVAGEPIRGSYWGHPKGNEIFQLTRAIRSSNEVVVCRLVDGKITYVHRRVWPAVVRLQESFDKERLGAVSEIHSPSGKHEVRVTPFPDWVPTSVREEAQQLTASEAASQLVEWFEGLSADL
ncbi:MAG: hypothetical protein V3U24_02165 [Candidatus Neomarinimicrobiota bacterium]